jgi:serine/threonine-protein kinase
VSVRPPVAPGVALDAPVDEAHLRATLTENGFAETYVSGEATPRDEIVRLSLSPPGPLVEGGEELEVKGVLGAGGMGRVLLATQRSLGRDVAVKVLRREGSPQAARTLVEEARLAGAVEHPGVVPLYALGSDARGQPVLVMKRVEGVTWRALLDEPQHPAWQRLAAAGAQPLDVHLGILQQVCNAIAFAHRRGVLHRDLKPSNVLVGEFGEVYVADWGVALRKDSEPARCLVGTPAYMAPEMVHGDATRLSDRTDVFLLGACLFEVLSGRPPWFGRTLVEALEKAAAGVLPPLPGHVPAELAAVARRALAVDPGARYGSALELRDALALAMRHRASGAITQATQERLAALADAVARGVAAEAVYPLLSECRFGFTQALREWPDNAEARAGRARALELGARFEVGQGHAAAARALLHELEVVPPALAGDVAALEAKDAAEQARSKRLGDFARELDPAVSRGPRNAVVVGLIVALLAFTLTRVLYREAWAGRWSLVYGSLAFNAVYFAAIGLARGTVLTTRLNRSLAGFFAAIVVGQVVLRTVAVLLGVPHAQALTLELVADAIATGAAIRSLHWSFGVASGLLLTSAGFALARPELVQPLYGVLTGVPFAVTAYLWRYWRSRDVGSGA